MDRALTPAELQHLLDLSREMLAIFDPSGEIRYLSRAWAEVARSHDGPIHLLITDVVMRGISGRELSDELVLDRPLLRTMYVSGYTENTIVHHGVLEPGIAFLAKPLTPVLLARRVREILAT